MADKLYFVMNLVLFQLLWFACVIGAGAYNYHALVALSLAALLVLAWFSNSRRNDFTIAAFALIAGFAIDNLWVQLNILSYPDTDYAPYWIAALWVGMGLTVNHSLNWLRDLKIIGPIVVGLFAPVTYAAGERFDAIEITSWYLLPIISIAWLGLFIIMVRLSQLPTSGDSESMRA